VQLAQPDPAGAAETAESLAAIADRSRHTRAEAEAELALGSVRAAAGDAAAREHLGATHDADRAAAFLRSLGVAGRTGPKLLGQLSKREIEVLRLLGERRLPPCPPAPPRRRAPAVTL
jgi:hypothetical protein